jgi:hypothetical protein
MPDIPYMISGLFQISMSNANKSTAFRKPTIRSNARNNWVSLSTNKQISFINSPRQLLKAKATTSQRLQSGDTIDTGDTGDSHKAKLIPPS